MINLVMGSNTTEQLRETKLALCNAKGGSPEHRLFCMVDRELRLREIMTVLRNTDRRDQVNNSGLR